MVPIPKDLNGKVNREFYDLYKEVFVMAGEAQVAMGRAIAGGKSEITVRELTAASASWRKRLFDLVGKIEANIINA